MELQFDGGPNGYSVTFDSLERGRVTVAAPTAAGAFEMFEKFWAQEEPARSAREERQAELDRIFEETMVASDKAFDESIKAIIAQHPKILPTKSFRRSGW